MQFKSQVDGGTRTGHSLNTLQAVCVAVYEAQLRGMIL